MWCSKVTAKCLATVSPSEPEKHMTPITCFCSVEISFYSFKELKKSNGYERDVSWNAEELKNEWKPEINKRLTKDLPSVGSCYSHRLWKHETSHYLKQSHAVLSNHDSWDHKYVNKPGFMMSAQACGSVLGYATLFIGTSLPHFVPPLAKP